MISSIFVLEVVFESSCLFYSNLFRLFFIRIGCLCTSPNLPVPTWFNSISSVSSESVKRIFENECWPVFFYIKPLLINPSSALLPLNEFNTLFYSWLLRKLYRLFLRLEFAVEFFSSSFSKLLSTLFKRVKGIFLLFKMLVCGP